MHATRCRKRRLLAFVSLLVVGLAASQCGGDGGGDGASSGTRDDFDEFAEALIAEHEIASLSVGVVVDGEMVLARAYGVADRTTATAATVDTIYGLASCSKPVVGLAVALAIEDPAIALDLDEDVNTYLGWDTPLEHPDHPDTPVTLRHLVTHTSGIASDSDADYETYPKPDPDQELDVYLETLLSDVDYWMETAPGATFEYSNLGTALAALVVQEAAGQDFRAFCNERLFDPLRMDDTRWFYSELSDSQRGRLARPHRDDGSAYEFYAFNDWPSGLLRTTVPDFARLLAMLQGRGALDGTRVLEAETVALFESVPLFINAGEEDGVALFDHSGGEAGVNTYFSYGSDGAGWVYLMNSDLSDDALEAVAGALDERLADEAAAL